MDYMLKTIEISSICVKEKKFLISTDTHNNNLLEKSIKRIGLLNPPYLYFDAIKQYYSIVCGYRRIAACIACGWKKISAYVIAADTKEPEIFLLGLYDNLAHRILNILELAHATTKLLTYFSEETVIRDYLPLMGLPPTHKTLEHLRALAGLEAEIQNAVANGTLAGAIAVKLAQRDIADQRAFMALLAQVHLSTGKQEEVFSYCSDISVRDNVSYQEIFNAPPIREILNQGKLNRTQKGDQLRSCLRKMRFPQLTQRENIFAQKLKKLRLPSGVQLAAPPFFEGRTFCLRVEFQDTQELEDKATHVLRLIKNNSFNDVLEVC